MDSNRTSPVRLRRAVVAAALALLSFTAAGCAGDDTAGEAAGPTAVEDDAQLEYFGSDQFLDDEVVVSSVVTGVIGEKSLVLDGSEYGDESLLVLSPDGLGDIGVGDVVKASGFVKQFVLADYGEEYGVFDEGVYDFYIDEEFLLADSIRKDGAGSPGAPTSSG